MPKFVLDSVKPLLKKKIKKCYFPAFFLFPKLSTRALVPRVVKYWTACKSVNQKSAEFYYLVETSLRKKCFPFAVTYMNFSNSNPITQFTYNHYLVSIMRCYGDLFHIRTFTEPSQVHRDFFPVAKLLTQFFVKMHSHLSDQLDQRHFLKVPFPRRRLKVLHNV